VTAELDDLVDASDRAYVSQIEDAGERRTVLASLVRHRSPETLAVGDPMPQVAVVEIEQRSVVRLDELVGGRPALLVFGSYT
jgi:hypothetical protein